ncbi:hypothetical protein [Fowlpox virus]|nr:hypothetical protein [Fowlpox virus]
MKKFIITQLQAMEESASVNLGILTILMNRCISTNWLLLNIFVHFILDGILTSCVLILAITSYISRNKKILLLASIINLSYELFIRFLIYLLYESID